MIQEMIDNAQTERDRLICQLKQAISATKWYNPLSVLKLRITLQIIKRLAVEVNIPDGIYKEDLTIPNNNIIIK